jgi:hypothetical protein
LQVARKIAPCNMAFSGMNWENTCAFILVNIKPITCHKINQSNGIGQNEV